MWQTLFNDRTDAGKQLAEALRDYASDSNTIVLALPRGGVPIGCEVADALGLPLDVLIVRKLGVPDQPELAMGAIASGGGRYINDSVVAHAGIGRETIERVAARELVELKRREQAFRGQRPPLDVHDRTVILVDDGVATGSTMIAGILALRAQQPRAVVVAVPVAPPETAEKLRGIADLFICLYEPADFYAVGEAYTHFRQTTDAEVSELLASRSHVQSTA